MKTDVLTATTSDGESFAGVLSSLTTQEQRYVTFCVQGLNPAAAARSAGFPRPADAVIAFAERPDIQHAIAFGREMSRQAALASGALNFTRDDATRLYLEAHAKADTAAEEIRAVDSLVKLHGLAEPEKKEVKITSQDQVRGLDTEELMRLAGDDAIELDPSQYEDVTNEQ